MTKNLNMKPIVKLLFKLIPYYSYLGFEILKIADGKAVFTLEIKEDLTQNGTIHGGALASMIDSSCACAAFSLIYPDAYVTTIDLQVQFLKPASKGKLTAYAKCVKSGKSIFFCKSKILNEENEIICTGTSQLKRVELNK